MLGGIVYWSGLDEASIGRHGDANVTSELEAAVAMLNARMAPNPQSAEAVAHCQMDWTPRGLHEQQGGES